MTIKLNIYKDPNADPIHREKDAGLTVEQVLRDYRSQLPWRIITARVDGDDVALSYVLEKDCDLVFCDIRDNEANRTFQRGLSLLYLKAVHDLFDYSAHVEICNSVSRGIFTKIVFIKEADSKREIDGDDTRRIERRMWEMVDKNLPIEITGKDNICKLEDYTNNFYGLMPVSTGYIYSFALELTNGGVLLRFPHPSDPSRLTIYKRDAKIFEAYEEEQKMLDSLNLRYIDDLNRQIKKGRTADIIRIAEDRHEEHIENIAEKIKNTGKRIVLLAGPSSSGKTTTSKRLIDMIATLGCPEPLYIGTDDYFVDREFAPRDRKGEYNFEGLDAVDVGLFIRNIEELLSGKTADIPRFDFIHGKKHYGERKSRLRKGQIIFVEGIHALNKKMTAGLEESLKYKIYISPLTQLNIDDHNRVPSTDVRALRRLIRDNRTRGHGVLNTLRQWPKVRLGESVNIFPYNNEADEIFNSTLVYELPVLKKYAVPLLKKVKRGEAAYGHAKWLLQFLSFFSTIEDDSPIPPNSILREFIGGGLYYK